MSHKTYTKDIVYTNTLHDAVTSTATSNAQLCAGVKAITLFFTKANDDGTLSADLTVTVSADGTNFYSYKMLLDNTTDSNSESLTRLDSKTRATDGTDILWFSPETLGAINYFKAVLTISSTGNGDFSVTSVIQY